MNNIIEAANSAEISTTFRSSLRHTDRVCLANPSSANMQKKYRSIDPVRKTIFGVKEISSSLMNERAVVILFIANIRKI